MTAPKPPKALRVFDEKGLTDNFWNEAALMARGDILIESTHEAFLEIIAKGARWQFDQDTREIEKLKSEVRLSNTIITSLQRAHKAYDEIRDARITQLEKELQEAKNGGK